MAISLPLGAGNTGTNDWGDVYGNDAQLVAEFDSRDSVYRTIATGAGFYPASTSGERYFAIGSATNGAALAATCTSQVGIQAIYLDDADYSVASKTTKLRLRVQQVTGPVAPGQSFNAGIYSIASTSGYVWTLGSRLGTVSTGSNGANTINHVDSGDFGFPTDGLYIVAVVPGGATAAGNSICDFSFQLQVRWT